MKNITHTNTIAALLSAFEAGKDGAFATCRLIDGADSAMDPQEWAELGTIDGVPAKIYYIFTAEEASSDNAEDYPWEADHIDRIELAEMDEDGDFEAL